MVKKKKRKRKDGWMDAVYYAWKGKENKMMAGVVLSYSLVCMLEMVTMQAHVQISFQQHDRLAKRTLIINKVLLGHVTFVYYLYKLTRINHVGDISLHHYIILCVFYVVIILFFFNLKHTIYKSCATKLV